MKKENIQLIGMLVLFTALIAFAKNINKPKEKK